ncbi:hypothetical protein DPEC_G00006190 [Dallia pectoralis]|uniref:Uncharacterized protein n=1 Tax=Dallia pectoralis TaxID=75939 RepID=A0ACC2HKZ3_DALPE|nr:hypothetical protein DPEC_G00365500 [Dallia pectoralis]KAJ8016340.1 hypothetical protein DPEC_G00006190 [Dallia pectoralis]
MGTELHFDSDDGKVEVGRQCHLDSSSLSMGTIINLHLTKLTPQGNVEVFVQAFMLVAKREGLCQTVRPVIRS